MYPGLFSPWHIAILVLVILLVFGPKRLPEMGRSLGRGMREFKDSISGSADDQDAALPADTATPISAAPGTVEGATPCHACGGEVASDAQFCSACGAAVEKRSVVSGASRGDS
jgi:sec-independent protein translocase protein TatA